MLPVVNVKGFPVRVQLEHDAPIVTLVAARAFTFIVGPIQLLRKY